MPGMARRAIWSSARGGRSRIRRWRCCDDWKSWTTPTDVVLAGSIFKAESPLLIDSVRHRLNGAAPLARVVRPEIEPVLGALFCGFDVVGREVHSAVRARAKASYELLTGRTIEEVGI